jgi:hypothetical protein
VITKNDKAQIFAELLMTRFHLDDDTDELDDDDDELDDEDDEDDDEDDEDEDTETWQV